MSKNLLLGNYRQPFGSNLCGPCCVKMILNHFGIDWDIKKIAQECNTLAGGTLEPGLVMGLLKAGLQPVFYASASGETFYGAHVHMSQEELAQDLQIQADKAKGKVRKKVFQELAEVARAGTLKFKLPTREVIEKELDEGHVWIVGVRAYILYDWQCRKDASKGHFIVIQGYNDENFIINDPAFDEGGVREINKDKLLFAMYCMGEGSGICARKDNE